MHAYILLYMYIIYTCTHIHTHNTHKHRRKGKQRRTRKGRRHPSRPPPSTLSLQLRNVCMAFPILKCGTPGGRRETHTNVIQKASDYKTLPANLSRLFGVHIFPLNKQITSFQLMPNQYTNYQSIFNNILPYQHPIDIPTLNAYNIALSSCRTSNTSAIKCTNHSSSQK